ncbi:hypothetical protein [Streptomyces silvisoli]|uniref:Uncharacterized protein n=1 Tax=Streptomyces silvisoli TaxID=3034235 RepID=A0ABT5ZFQ5_9ACTN|nr:hypothetical protein [Streptomyces silvisoli]MDF3288658.1 hypothetical protein [Streptomyces silvisoli]
MSCSAPAAPQSTRKKPSAVRTVYAWPTVKRNIQMSVVSCTVSMDADGSSREGVAPRG